MTVMHNTSSFSATTGNTSPKTKVNLSFFSFKGRNQRLTSTRRLERDVTNPLWKGMGIKCTLTVGRKADVVFRIKKLIKHDNSIGFSAGKSKYLSSHLKEPFPCASLLLKQDDEGDLIGRVEATLENTKEREQMFWLHPQFNRKSTLENTHIIELIINGEVCASYPIRIYGPRSGQRAKHTVPKGTPLLSEDNFEVSGDSASFSSSYSSSHPSPISPLSPQSSYSGASDSSPGFKVEEDDFMEDVEEDDDHNSDAQSRYSSENQLQEQQTQRFSSSMQKQQFQFQAPASKPYYNLPLSSSGNMLRTSTGSLSQSNSFAYCIEQFEQILGSQEEMGDEDLEFGPFTQQLIYTCPPASIKQEQSYMNDPYMNLVYNSGATPSMYDMKQEKQQLSGSCDNFVLNCLERSSSPNIFQQQQQQQQQQVQPILASDDDIQPGDVIGFRASEGRWTKKTFGDCTAYAIYPEEQLKDVPVTGVIYAAKVRVHGDVRAGDFLLPSDLNDGSAIAKSEQRMTAFDYARVCGFATPRPSDPVGFVTATFELPQAM